MHRPAQRPGFTLVELPAVSKGFTLVELLVVVAIIAILLSLLAPAMDKAIYQAELVQCGANQRAITGGLQRYCFDHGRRYPIDMNFCYDDGSVARYNRVLYRENNLNSDSRMERVRNGNRQQGVVGSSQVPRQ